MRKGILILLTIIGGLCTRTGASNTWNGSGSGKLVNGQYYAIYETGTSTQTTVGTDIKTYSLQAPADGTLTFDYKKYTSISISGTIKVYDQSSNTLGSVGYSSTNWKNTSVGIGLTVNKVRFNMPSGTGASIRNIILPMAKYLEAKTTEIAFDEAPTATVAPTQEVKLAWSNVGNSISWQVENNGGTADACQDVTVAIDRQSATGCYGNSTLTIGYTRAHEGTLNANLRLTAGGKSVTIKLTGSSTTLQVPTAIHYLGASIYNADQANLSVSSLFSVTYNDGRNIVDGAIISLTSDATHIVSIGAGNTLVFGKGAGTAHITATYSGNAQYEGSSLTQTITVRMQGALCLTPLLDATTDRTFSATGSEPLLLADGPRGVLTFEWLKWNLITIDGENSLMGYDSATNSWRKLLTLPTPTTSWTKVSYTFTQADQSITHLKWISRGNIGDWEFDVEPEWKSVRNVLLLQEDHLRANTLSPTMPATKVGKPATTEVRISYSALPKLVLSADPAISWKVQKDGVELPDFQNDCSDYGDYTLTLQYTPSVAGPYSKEVNISAADKSLSILLNGIAEENSYIFNGTTNDNWGVVSNWSDTEAPSASDNVVVAADVIISGNVEVRSLTILPDAHVSVAITGHLTIGEGSSNVLAEYGDLVIQSGGQLTLNSGRLQLRHFIIEAAETSSGEVSNAEQMTVNGDAYIDINLTSQTPEEDSYYAFAVPFPVDVRQGVYRYNGSTFVKAAYFEDYAIAEYNATQRYNTGNGWQFADGTLQPGRFYMIQMEGAGKAQCYRFKKTTTGALQADANLTLSLCGSNSSSRDANWNAVGNPTLQHAAADCDYDYVQVYDNNLAQYITVPTAETAFSVGRPFFVQAAVGKSSTLTLSPATPMQTLLCAPGRRQTATSEAIRVGLQDAEGHGDQLFLSADDDASGVYTPGVDLAKAGVSTRVPQLWIDRYEARLSVNCQQWDNDQAAYPLHLWVPKEGEYTLSATPTEGTLYLLYQGQPYRVLSGETITLTLPAGLSTDYSLLLSRQAPGISTSLKGPEAGEKATKCLINGQLFILTNDATYTIDGQRIR